MTTCSPTLQRFGRFNFVGLLGAGLQLLLIVAFTSWLSLPVAVATPLAVELVLLHNFAWHERFTWSDRPFLSRKDRLLALWRFHAGNGVISIAGNTALVYCLAEKFHLPALIASAMAIVVCSSLNFVLAGRWVYRRRRAVA